MADSKKRKEQTIDGNEQRSFKRSKGGSGGKWQTPHQKSKGAARTQGQIEPGDSGIWATCAKGQERRATEELRTMLEDCARRFYGLTSDAEEGTADDGESEEDIEKAIRKELSTQKSTVKLFRSVHLGLPCLLFFKTSSSIDPVDLVQRICKEVVQDPDVRRMRYINRLTPVTLMTKANEKGLDELTIAILSKHFELVKTTGVEGEDTSSNQPNSIAPASYAIRPTIRAHNTLKRDVVIKRLASSISDVHKVDLTTPDKVILIEIYTTVCGISVVDGEWEKLKRFNIAELYPKPATSTPSSEALEANT